MSALSFQDAITLVGREDWEKRLTDAGWVKEPCKACDSLGSVPTAIDPQQELNEVARRLSRRVCEDCRGSGHVWREPGK